MPRSKVVWLRALLVASSLALPGVVGCVPKRPPSPPQDARASSSSPRPPSSPGDAPAAAPLAGDQAPPPPRPVKPTKRYAEAPRSHREALLHQLDARFQKRSDRDRHVELPMADSRHWKRVRFTGVDHLTGFVYGEDRSLLTSAFTFELEPGERPTTALCMERFERDNLTKFRRAKGTFTPIQETLGSWKKEPLLIHRADGRLTVFFSRYEFSAAWAAYPAYENGCLVYATVVFWDDDEELARRVRDHWVEQAFGGVKTRGTAVPSRR